MGWRSLSTSISGRYGLQTLLHPVLPGCVTRITPTFDRFGETSFQITDKFTREWYTRSVRWGQMRFLCFCVQVSFWTRSYRRRQNESYPCLIFGVFTSSCPFVSLTPHRHVTYEDSVIWWLPTLLCILRVTEIGPSSFGLTFPTPYPSFPCSPCSTVNASYLSDLQTICRVLMTISTTWHVTFKRFSSKIHESGVRYPQVSTQLKELTSLVKWYTIFLWNVWNLYMSKILLLGLCLL